MTFIAPRFNTTTFKIESYATQGHPLYWTWKYIYSRIGASIMFASSKRLSYHLRSTNIIQKLRNSLLFHNIKAYVITSGQSPIWWTICKLSYTLLAHLLASILKPNISPRAKPLVAAEHSVLEIWCMCSLCLSSPRFNLAHQHEPASSSLSGVFVRLLFVILCSVERREGRNLWFQPFES